MNRRLIWSLLFGWLSLGLLLSSRGVSAAENPKPISLSLPQALQLAKERHVQVLVAQERVQQALAQIGQAKSGLLPHLNVAISQYRKTVNLAAFGIDPGVASFDLTPPPFNVFDARISLQQNLFDLTVLRRLHAAQTGQRLSISEQEKAEADALVLVANLYFEAQRAQEAVEYVTALQRRDTARLGISDAQRYLGLGSSIDVTGAQAALAQSRNLVAQARTQAEEKRLDLIAAIGLPPEQPIRFTSQEAWLKKSVPQESELEGLMVGHPDIEVATKQLELRVKERSQEKAEYYPKIGLSADVGASGTHPANITDTYSFGGQVAVPIWQGGLRKARLQEASSKIRESESQVDQTRRDVLAKAHGSLLTLRQVAVAYRATQADLNKASQTLSLARERKNIGVGNDLEVIEAAAAYATAKDAQSEALAAYRLAWVGFEYRLGRMNPWIEELKEP